MAKKVLIVDDEADIRALIEALLKDEGYEVSTAANGEEGLATLKKEKFDLALLDFFMPGMSGRELAEEIRKDPQIKDSKIAFLTVAQFSEKGEEELKKLGSLDYIKKPIDNEDFKTRVKKIVG